MFRARASFIFAFVVFSHLLIACTPQPTAKQLGITPESIMAEKGGPAVGTMEAALLESATASVKKNDYLRAAELYQQLTQRMPDKDVYKLAYADALRRSGQLPKARTAYEDFLRTHPDSLVAHEGRGLVLLGQGEIALAIKTLSAVRQRDPSRWRSLNGLGIAHSMQQKFDDALGYYREALKASENNPSILNNIGLALAIKEDYPRAIQAMELARGHTDGVQEVDVKRIHLNLAMIYGLSGDMEKASDTAKPYLSESELYNNLGHYAYLAKNKDLARTYLNMALTASKEYYERAWDNLKEVGNGE